MAEWLICGLLLILAVEPGERLVTRYRNWSHRRRVHREWERESGDE